MAAEGTIELHLPSDLVIGAGASDDLAEHVARIGVARPLVVSDRFLLEEGPAGPLAERLQDAGVAVVVFGDVQPDPTLENVNNSLAAMRDHEADGVVAIGGGSPMETAKAAAVAFANPGDVLLPAVTRFSVMGAPERYAHVAREMSLVTDEDSDQIACVRLVEELEALNADLKIPSLLEADVDRDHFERVVQDMAQAALDSGSPGFNPQPATKKQIVELYHQAF